MHERTTHDTSNCSIARTLDVVGEKWTILILREAMYGVTRFDDLHQVLQCPRNLLSKRLRKLVNEGILSEQPYQVPGSRRRVEYVLTPKGNDLVPAVLGLFEWGDTYKADPEGPALLVRHRDCGSPVRLELRCDDEDKAVGADALETVSGPAFRLLPQA